MELTFILALSIVLFVVFFSSGIRIVSARHRLMIERFGLRSRFSRWVSNGFLSIIRVTGKAHRAWIRMISPGGDIDSK